jgi:predicted amino acid-binding ACT domain protein
MALKVSREDVWVAGIADQPGGLADKLDALAKAKAQLEFVIARRTAEKPGEGVVFVTPLKGAAQMAAAKKAGFHKSKSLNSIRIEGADKPGLGAKITKALAAKKINVRGLSAGVIGKRFVLHLALDSDKDAKKAMQVLKGM